MFKQSFVIVLVALFAHSVAEEYEWNEVGFVNPPNNTVLQHINYLNDSRTPNATASFPFQLDGQDGEWNLRINVTESWSSDGNRTSNVSRVLTTLYELSWPGNKTLSETVPYPKTPSTEPRFCFYAATPLFPVDVTNAYKGGSSCNDALGADCVTAMTQNIDAKMQNQSELFDGCPMQYYFDQSVFDKCKGRLSDGGVTGVGLGDGLGEARDSGFEYLNNTFSSGSVPNVSYPQRHSGDAFYYRMPEAYPAGNTTRFQRETERLHVAYVTGSGSTSVLCMRVNGTAQVKKGDPGVASSASSFKVSFGLWVGASLTLAMCLFG